MHAQNSICLKQKNGIQIATVILGKHFIVGKTVGLFGQKDDLNPSMTSGSQKQSWCLDVRINCIIIKAKSHQDSTSVLCAATTVGFLHTSTYRYVRNGSSFYKWQTAGLPFKNQAWPFWDKVIITITPMWINPKLNVCDLYAMFCRIYTSHAMIYSWKKALSHF